MTFKKLLIVDDSELDRLTLQKIAEKNAVFLSQTYFANKNTVDKSIKKMKKTKIQNMNDYQILANVSVYDNRGRITEAPRETIANAEFFMEMINMPTTKQ